MMKRLLSALLCAVISICLLASCGEKTVTYGSDIPVSDLCAAADAKLADSSTMAVMESDYIKGMMNIDTASFEEYAVKVQASGANVNEYGVFKAPSDDAVEGIKSTVQEYLKMRNDTWMTEYMPEEYPKVQNATTKVFGRYVVYCILSDTDKDAVFTAIENTLLGK